MNERYYSLDLIRFGGALIIFTIHFFVIKIFFCPYEPSYDSFYDTLFGTGDAVIKIFFCLSGFIISRNYGYDFSNNHWSVKAYFYNRFFRTAPLYYLLLICYLTIHSLTDVLQNVEYESATNELHWGYYSLYVFMLPEFSVLFFDYFSIVLNVSWSVGVEWLFYLTFPLVLILRKRLLIVVSLYLLYATCLYFTPVHIADMFTFINNLSFSSFMSGCFFGLISENTTIKKIKPLLFGLSSSALLFLIIRWGYVPLSAKVYIYPALLGIFIYSSTSLALDTRIKTFVIWTGNFSYSMYLFHPLLIIIVFKSLAAMGYTKIIGTNTMVIYIICLLLQLLFSYAIYSKIEVLFIRYGKRLSN